MNQADCPKPDDFVIRVRGHLDEASSYWFEGLTMITSFDEDDRPITTLSGPLADQAALHGVLAKIRDMNLPLISVSQTRPGQND